MALKTPQPKESTEALLANGERLISKLFSEGHYLQVKDYTEKLLQIELGTPILKVNLLEALKKMALRNDYIRFARQFIDDSGIDEKTKASICENAFLYCDHVCEFTYAIEFGERYLGLPQNITDENGRMRMRGGIELAKANLATQSEIAAVRKPGSPIPGISPAQYELITLMSAPFRRLKGEEVKRGKLFLASCIGTTQLSKTFREASSPTGVESLWSTGASSQDVRMSSGVVGVTGHTGAKVSSVRSHLFQEDLISFIRKLSVLAYKTQPENLARYAKALSKLAIVLEQLVLRKDFEAYKRLSEVLDPDRSKELLPGDVTAAQSFDQSKLTQAHQRYSQEMERVRERGSCPIDKLTKDDLIALNSLIKLKNDPVPDKVKELIQDNPDILAIIEQGKCAEEMVGKLLSILGEGYQTGDLSFRNYYKFIAFTGKSEGFPVSTYQALWSPFGHAAIIDASVGGDSPMYSEVIIGYKYGSIPIEEFFSTDTYRLNVSSLVSEEGKKLISERLEQLKNHAMISPFMTVDQYIQESFCYHLESILAGPDISSLLIEDVPETSARQLAAHHQRAFGAVQNDAMLQLRAGMNPVHSVMGVSSALPGTAFKEVKFEGKMICSQFQALAVLKALALTQDTLYTSMAEAIARRGQDQEMVTDMEIALSVEPDEPLFMIEEPEKTEEQARIYETALAEVQKKALFEFPVRNAERQTALTPKRVVELFRKHLIPVPMAPVVREILDLPEQFFGTHLFGTTQ
jgi:hypothetical protein